MNRAPITTHILDTARGCPAAGVGVSLSRRKGPSAQEMGRGVTDNDGRVMIGLIATDQFEPGIYELRFDIAAYFADQNQSTFYPEVILCFEVLAGQAHYHVPLLISPFGYSTYRGS